MAQLILLPELKYLNSTLFKANIVLLKRSQIQFYISHKQISTSQSQSTYKKCFNTFLGATNPFIDGPDFTYLDGRPTPLRIKQRRRAVLQKDTMAKAFEMIDEIDFAVKRFDAMTQKEKEERRKTIESKFREKGLPMNGN